MTTCPKCASTVEADSAFCSSCGARVAAAMPTPEAARPVAPVLAASMLGTPVLATPVLAAAAPAMAGATSAMAGAASTGPAPARSRMSLLPGERVVLGSHGDALVLTNRRVRYDATQFGSSKFIGITLDSVASCGLVTKSWPVLLWLAAASALAAMSIMRDLAPGLFLLAAFLVGAYFLTRTAMISVASKGGEAIEVATRGMNREEIVKFLEAVEREKLVAAGAGA